MYTIAKVQRYSFMRWRFSLISHSSCHLFYFLFFRVLSWAGHRKSFNSPWLSRPPCRPWSPLSMNLPRWLQTILIFFNIYVLAIEPFKLMIPCWWKLATWFNLCGARHCIINLLISDGSLRTETDLNPFYMNCQTLLDWSWKKISYGV